MNPIGIIWAAIWNDAIWDTTIWAQTGDTQSAGGEKRVKKMFTMVS
jgi:hypothetical protein